MRFHRSGSAKSLANEHHLDVNVVPSLAVQGRPKWLGKAVASKNGNYIILTHGPHTSLVSFTHNVHTKITQFTLAAQCPTNGVFHARTPKRKPILSLLSWLGGWAQISTRCEEQRLLIPWSSILVSLPCAQGRREKYLQSTVLPTAIIKIDSAGCMFKILLNAINHGAALPCSQFTNPTTPSLETSCRARIMLIGNMLSVVAILQHHHFWTASYPKRKSHDRCVWL